MGKDLLLLASSKSILFSDATTNFSAEDSAEANSEMRLLTKRFAPAGPAGDVVFRRIYLSFSFQVGSAFRITPVVDGRAITDCTRIVNRRGSGTEETRYTAVVPLGEVLFGRTHASGVRGSAIQILVNTQAPDYLWHIEAIDILFQMGLTARRE